MARIYLGRSTGIGSFERHVVLKMILPERAHDHVSVQMFLDEARLAASLNHQNVAQVFEVGEEGGVHFLAMEYVHGQDLRALLAKAGSEGTRVPLELALTVVAGAAAGLHHAHERRTSDGVPMGIVHRDVSPSNIMIGYDGSVKLLDFGIAKATMRSVETQNGVIKGKFAYMAPEQCRGRDVDRRSDVFSLGIILYEVTTQHRCFRADSDFDTMHRIVTGDVVRPTRLVLGYPQALEAIVMKALALDVTQRYQSSGELLEAVESFAIATRMSLSTMSLGRFMRDMFGDIQEPWLMQGRLDSQGAPKEHTVSNTASGGQRSERADRSGRTSSPPPLAPPPMRHEDAPLHLSPTSSQHDLQPQPHDALDERQSEVASWSVQPYPSPLPQLYSPSATPPPELRDPRESREWPSSPNLPPMAPQLPSSLVRPTGSQPIPQMQFSARTGSASGPAHPAHPVYPAAPAGSQPIVRTRQGYTGAPGQSESSYARYEAPDARDARDARDAPDGGGADPDVDLQPSNRLLYLGIGVVLVGIIILLAISIADGRGDDPRQSRATGTPGATGTPSPANTTAGVPGTAPDPVDAGAAVLAPPPISPESFALDAGASDARSPMLSDEISVHIASNPTNSDVLLAGKPIGTTPLDTHMKRSAAFATLTIHHARFQDASTTIDLSGDFSRELTLTAVPDEPVRPPPPTPPRPNGGRNPGGGGHEPRDPHDPKDPKDPKDQGHSRVSPPPPQPPAPPPPQPPAAKKCQPPDRLNPFDTNCDGHACPPCA